VTALIADGALFRLLHRDAWTALAHPIVAAAVGSWCGAWFVPLDWGTVWQVRLLQSLPHCLASAVVVVRPNLHARRCNDEFPSAVARRSGRLRP
jgi:hypothetical protein